MLHARQVDHQNCAASPRLPCPRGRVGWQNSSGGVQGGQGLVTSRASPRTQDLGFNVRYGTPRPLHRLKHQRVALACSSAWRSSQCFQARWLAATATSGTSFGRLLCLRTEGTCTLYLYAQYEHRWEARPRCPEVWKALLGRGG